MPSFYHILEDFICSISACSQTTDLEKLLEIVQLSPNPTIAVIDEQQHPIGVVNGSRLLAFIIEQWSKAARDSAVDGEPRENHTDIAATFKLCDWIEPIVSFKSDLSLEELVSHTNQGIITQSKQQNYLVVDANGKLRGLLDTFRLNQWLFFHQIQVDRFLPEQSVQTIPSLDLPIFKLMEQIPVPLMLETKSGNALYKNQCWQQQVGITEILNPLEINKFIQFILSDFLNFQPTYEPKKLTPYCQKGNYHLSPFFADLSPQIITFKSQRILEMVTNKRINSSTYLKENEQLKLPNVELNSLSLPTLKEQWQYIKIPLNLTDKQLSYLNLSSPILLLIAIKLPLTEKNTCQQSQQNIELVKLNQLKDEFLASISHELKSPLTAIVGLSSLLKEEKLGQLNQRQIRYSELIYRSGKQLMKIVSDMLELTYLATGKLELNFEPTNIKSLCTEVYQQLLNKSAKLNPLPEKAAIKPQFKISIDNDLEIVLADRIRLRQILIYLLDNALKSIQWKEATLSTPQKNIAITINCWNNWIAITVVDDGIGIPEENQPLLLERCFPSDNYLNHRYDDIGLGLILAQQLAKAHGGDISFTSCWGRGSKFTLLLPSSSTKISPEITSVPSSIASWRQSLELSYYNHPYKQSQSDSIAPKKPQNNLLVLIIDSVAEQINELDLQLQELGYHPIIARTSMEALQKARQFKPGKIFLNSSLSQLADTDILTLLKSDSLTAEIPVFLLISHLSEQQKYPQADGFLTIPIEQKSLITIVPSVQKDFSKTQKPLTILHLYPESESTSHLKIIDNSDLNFALNEHLSGLNHRVLEADSLEQGELLARIWQIDAIVLDGRILQEPLVYLRSLRKSSSLSSLPLVTLDAKTTEAANLIKGLAVFPCLLPEEETNLANLVKVIQIAARIGKNH